MKSFLKRRNVLIGIGAIVVIIIILSTRSKDISSTWTTDTVSRGEVSQIVSVSGILEAEDKADLSFPTTGTVSSVLVKAGDTVTKGQVLATLEQAELLADRSNAYGTFLIASANKSELVNGPRDEERDITDVSVSIARDNVERITAEENDKVTNAYRSLLSDDLVAVPVDKENSDAPPTVSGTYTCAKEGTYTLTMFRSAAQSGHSYRMSGLENGTYTAYTETPAPLGTCGLSIQFVANETYSSKEWVIEVPNTRSASHTTNLNAYTLALQQRDNAIQSAKQDLEKALKEQTLENASPRNEALGRADAAVIQAQAQLAAIDARIEDRTIRAPFDGVVSDVEIVVGESVGADTAMTIVADTFYELTVRIPEIDITKVHVGQATEVTFDARVDEVVQGEIGFISPLATMIDGVAYFEAKVRFVNPPEWFRSGLNADVDVIVERKTDVLRIPKRFLIEENDTYHVLTPKSDKTGTESTSITIGFTGNNGFVEVYDIADGTTVVAP